MKYVKILCLLLTLGLLLEVNAQQDPHFSTYKYNFNIINPAYAGTNDGIEAYTGVRDQWLGIPEAPVTKVFNINSPVGKNMGLGLNVLNDNVFIVNEVHLYTDFSYKLKIGEKTKLFLGLKAGGSFLKIDLNTLGVQGDPLLTGNVNTFNPNFGVGGYLKGDKYYVSLSVPGLLKNDRIEKDGIQPSEATDVSHVFLGGGYDFTLNDDWLIKPSALIKGASGAPLSIDTTVLLEYRGKFEFGANYRWDESYTGLVTFLFNDFAKIGFAYENTTTDVGIYNDGTYELFLKFLFKNKKR